MLSSWIFRNSLSSRRFALCARAASSRRCGRRKLPICSTRNGGSMPRSSPDDRLDVDLDAAIGRAAAFRIVARHRLAPPPAEGGEAPRGGMAGIGVMRPRHGAPLPEILVFLVWAHLVCLPDDCHPGLP